MGLAGQCHPPGFVAWTTPEWTIISGDSRSNRSEVADAYIRQGARVLNTSQLGAVTVKVDRTGLRVNTWRQMNATSSDAPWPAVDEDDSNEMSLELR